MSVIIFFLYFFEIIDLKLLIPACVVIVANTFMILAGHLKKNEFKFTKISIISGIMNIFFQTFYFVFPIQITFVDSQLLNTFLFLRSLIFNIVPIFTYGVHFLIVGLKNSENNRHYLKKIGIMYLIYTLIYLVSFPSYYEMPLLIYLNIPVLITFVGICYFIIIGLGIIFPIILMYISYKNYDYLIFYLALFLLISQASMLILSIF